MMMLEEPASAAVPAPWATLSRLGEVLLVFFVVNAALSPLPTKASLAADLFAAVLRIGIAGVAVGVLSRRRSRSAWWHRILAAVPLLLMVAALGSVLVMLMQGRRVFIGAFVVELLRDLGEAVVALVIASAIAKR